MEKISWRIRVLLLQCKCQPNKGGYVIFQLLIFYPDLFNSAVVLIQRSETLFSSLYTTNLYRSPA